VNAGVVDVIVYIRVVHVDCSLVVCVNVGCICDGVGWIGVVIVGDVC